MVHPITRYANLDERRLMSLYAEGNRENADYFYPEMEDREAAVRQAEKDFLHDLENDFFTCPGRTYWVLEEQHEWVSAVRLYQLKPDFYYLEALETHPAYRKKGYASKLLREVICALRKKGAFQLCDCVSKKNIASLRTHERCGFQIVSDEGFDYLRNESDERFLGLAYSYDGGSEKDGTDC